MKTKIALFLLISLVATLQLSYAEEQPKGDELFKPATSIGACYEGRMQAEGDLTIEANFWRSTSGRNDWKYFAYSEYRHQTIGLSEDSSCLSAVRFFEDAKFNADISRKPAQANTTLSGKKLFARLLDPPVVKPGANPSQLDSAIMLIDFDDPFRTLLPDKALKKDLTWEPNGAAIGLLLARTGGLRTAAQQMHIKATESGKDAPKKSPDVFMERFDPPPEDTSPPPMNMWFNNISANGTIESFRIDSFSASITFTGTASMAVGMGRQEVPINGTISFTYDVANRALKQGEIEVSAKFEGTMKVWRSDIPVKINYKERMSLNREYSPSQPLAKGVTAECRVFDSPLDSAPVLVAAQKDGLVLLANWDGTPGYEVLNKAKPIKEIATLPTAGAVSADGQCFVLAFPDQLLTSSDGGETFKTMVNKGTVKAMWFFNSEKSNAVLLMEDGEFLKLEMGKKPVVKKLSSPIAGKKIIYAVPGPEHDSLYTVIPEGYFYTVDGGKARKMMNPLDENPILMCPAENGVIILTSMLHRLTVEEDKALVAINLPQKIVAMTSADKSILMLSDTGELFAVPGEGGEASPVSAGVKNAVFAFKRIFMAKDSGVEIK